MFVPVFRWLPLALIALAAFWLRTHDLDRRPMHADEANQAVKAGQLLETGYYAFDPRDHHGPTLYYAALPIAFIRGEHTLATLTETTVRLVPAIGGTIGVFLLALLASPLGRWPAHVAAAMMAVSPPAVYYSRYFIQETLLVTFTLGAFLCVYQWWRRGHPGFAVGAGLCLGLMLATKASAPLFLIVGAIALIAVRPARPRSSARVKSIGIAALCALVVATLFYSSFGTHLTGLRDALSVYDFGTARATGESGHEKPWWYYLRLFGWHREGGLLWHQIAFTAAAALGGAVAFLRRNALLSLAAIYTALLAIVFSVTPYKTPWHAVHLVPGLAVLAAGGVSLLRPPWLSLTLAAVVVFFQARQTERVAFLRPADARNPYAYVHSSPDVVKFRALADAALARDPNGVIRVISEEYWPLPWYLRGLEQVGYWSAPPDDCNGALVIASADLAEVVSSRLRGRYKETYLGLRPGFLCVVFTPES